MIVGDTSGAPGFTCSKPLTKQAQEGHEDEADVLTDV